jgi:hypothetical protein
VGSNPGKSVGKTATNRLSYETASEIVDDDGDKSEVHADCGDSDGGDLRHCACLFFTGTYRLLLVRSLDYQSFPHQALQLTGALRHRYEFYSHTTTVKKKVEYAISVTFCMSLI